MFSTDTSATSYQAYWGKVGRTPDCQTRRRCSRPPAAVLKLFVYPTLPVSFGRNAKNVGPFSLLSTPGGVGDHT